MKKLPFFIGLALAAAGCGGSSGGQSVSVEASPIRLFADDSGVGKLRGSSGGEVQTGFVLGPELALILEEFRETSEVEPFDTSNLPIVATGPNTVIREGAVSEDSAILNVLAAVTLDDDAALVLFEEPTFGDTLLLSVGIEATNLPSSGSASYSGILGMQDIVFDAEPELGTFTATANFDDPTPTVSFNGSTNSYAVTGTALVDGKSFSSTTLSISDSAIIGSISGSINGDFHGDGGNSMAGVIYSNDDFGDYRGGFVGSQ